MAPLPKFAARKRQEASLCQLRIFTQWAQKFHRLGHSEAFDTPRHADLLHPPYSSKFLRNILLTSESEPK
jgi:hypothetical protein